jgi:hypothetical protein
LEHFLLQIAKETRQDKTIRYHRMDKWTMGLNKLTLTIETITSESRQALTRIVSMSVDTFTVSIAFVCLGSTFIDVDTIKRVSSSESRQTLTMIRTIGINTLGIVSAQISSNSTQSITLIYIGTQFTVSPITVGTFASEPGL